MYLVWREQMAEYKTFQIKNKQKCKWAKNSSVTDTSALFFWSIKPASVTYLWSTTLNIQIFKTILPHNWIRTISSLLYVFSLLFPSIRTHCQLQECVLFPWYKGSKKKLIVWKGLVRNGQYFSRQWKITFKV